MITSMHDRYYIPADEMCASDWEEEQESRARELIQAGEECDWRNESLFYEALSECGIDEGSGDERITPDNCSEDVLKLVTGYAWKIAMYLAKNRMEDEGY